MLGSFDVVIVGAGPAGSIAARVLAKKGFKTLVLEKRQEIGAPKRCGEAVNLKNLRLVGVEPDTSWICREMEGSVIHAPGGEEIVIPSDSESVEYIIERKIFEKHLARDAIRAGARYMVKTTVTGVVMEGGRVVGVRARHMGRDFVVGCKLVIAADGADSKIARSAGIRTTNVMDGYHAGFQYEMAGLHMDKSSFMHVYFGNEAVPKGYIWIFPKDTDVANVGIGMLGKYSGTKENARYFLDKFIRDHQEIFRDASPIEINSGGIPASPDLDSLTVDGLMVVGDAAHQVNPIHGGGMYYAMYAGKIAAEVASEALFEGNVSKERLSEYEALWANVEGRNAKKLLRIRQFLERLEDKDFDTIASVVSTQDITALTEGDCKPVLKKLVLKSPRLVPVVKRFFG